jgi:biotin carboxylase
VPAIIRASELGCHVTTLDFLPGNVGHRFAHRRVNASTTDAPAVIAHARELGIEAVMTIASDVAVPTVAAVAEALDLPGCSVATARTLTDKGAFRALQHRLDVSAPGFAVVTDEADALASCWRLGPSVVVKPVDASGSRGMTLVTNPEEEVREAYGHAAAASRSGRVCIERYVAGQDLSGDGLLQDGRFVLAALTRKRVAGFVVVGHEVPAGLPDATTAAVLRHVAEVAAAAGYREGPLDFDVRLDEHDQPTILEMSPRLGGNALPLLVTEAAGVDLIGLAVEAAFGRTPSRSLPWSPRGRAGVWIFGAERPGRLPRVPTPDELGAAADVLALALQYGEGDAVEPHRHGGAALGHVVFRLGSGECYDDAVARLAGVVRSAVGELMGGPG